ncbi:tetratricopeptide repeat protein [Lagierella massiliensis]|uniref:tetratricopeptide repeat protein n=1 Tax=Lagierella massiliensis TaxID=1689303 RepID=UPI0006D7EE27|nr:tetratricopeptide repeat protein [Lagierella massiliensis]
MNKYRRSDNYIKLAQNFYLNGEYKKSVELLNKALRFDNTEEKYIEIYLDKAQIYFELENYYNAIKVYNVIIERFGEILQAYYGIGVMYDFLNEFYQAEKYYKKSISIDENFREGYFFLADLYDRNGYTKKAICYYKKTIKKFPTDYMAYNNLGSIYELQKDYEDALKYFKMSVEINPEYFRSTFNLGIAYDRLDVEDKALKYYYKALELNPEYQDIYLNISAFYIKRNRLMESIDILTDGILNAEKKYNLYYNRACIHLKIGDEKKSFSDLENAVIENPKLMDYLKVDHDFDDYRKDERYLKIINSRRI